MLVVRTLECRADPLGQLVGTEQTRGLDHLAFAVNPFGLDCVEPRALFGHQTGDDPHSTTTLFDSSVVRTDPAPDLTAYVPAGIVPDQHPNPLLPMATNLWQHHSKKRVVIPLTTGRPSTKRGHVLPSSGVYRVRSKRWPSDRGRLFRPSAQPDAAAHPLR